VPVLVIVPDRPLLRKTWRPIATFVVVATVGVAGFVTLEGVSVVEALFWLLDPTSIELHGVGDDVRAFALVVFGGLILSGLWMGETVVEAAFHGQIQEELKRVHMKRQIEDLSGHVVVCGYGMFGRTIANTMREDGRDVVAIETNDQEFTRVETDEILGVRGDARLEGTMKDAGIDRADVLVAAIDDSNANIQIAITASQLAPSLTVVVRVGDEMYEPLARRAGADEVVIPEIVSGQQVTQTLRAAGLERTNSSIESPSSLSDTGAIDDR
jgi:hypothetical protein